MRIFISWSGERSRKVALLLHDWLPTVIQAVVPFMSTEDIPKGAQWLSVLNDKLNESAFGIICVTEENQVAPWLNFEAGAIAKAVGEVRVCPLLLGIGAADVKAPLSNFQMANATKTDMWKMLKSINSVLGKDLSDETLRKIFEKWWPDLEAGIAEAIATNAPAARQHRDDSDLIRETLLTVREQGRLLSHLVSATPIPSIFPAINPLFPAMNPLLGYAIGDIVKHSKWGEGEIINLVGTGNDGLVTIKFHNHDVKMLMLKYAPLEKVRTASPVRNNFWDDLEPDDDAADDSNGDEDEGGEDQDSSDTQDDDYGDDQ